MARIAIVLKVEHDGDLAQVRAQAMLGFHGEEFDVHLACAAPLVPAARALAALWGANSKVFDSEADGLFEQVLHSIGPAEDQAVAFLPTTADLDWQGWRDVATAGPAFKIWPPRIGLPSLAAHEHQYRSLGWTASRASIEAACRLDLASPFDDFAVADAFSRSPSKTIWKSLSLAVDTAPAPAAGSPELSLRSKVLAIVPHYRCERWLAQCLDSLVAQTRPLDAIAVIDDGSPEPPRNLVELYPGVTLLRSRQNVGPYCLIQTIVDSTGYDAYLFQDADDWTTSDRLERLLTEAERSGAELMGSQEIRVYTEAKQIQLVCYPLDVNEALKGRPTFSLFHPTSLAARSLIVRAGGFATGLRFGGDTEFLLRASRIGRVVNVNAFCYYHRVRADSLTTHPATGIRSPARARLWGAILKRDQDERLRIASGEPPSLSPISVREPAVLDHICGPPLSSV